MLRRGTPPHESENIPNTGFSCRNGAVDGTRALRGVRWRTWLAGLGRKSQWQFKHWNVAAAWMQSSNTRRGWREQEGDLGGRGLGREGPGKGGHREGAGEKHKGFHVATGREGRHAFRPSENKNEKPKPKQKPQMPCQTKRAITWSYGTPTALSEEQRALTSRPFIAVVAQTPVTTGAPGCALLCSRFPALKSHTHSTHSDTPPLPRGRAAGHARARTPYTQGDRPENKPYH